MSLLTAELRLYPTSGENVKESKRKNTGLNRQKGKISSERTNVRAKRVHEV
jgi:hypothetical protein